MGFGTTCFRRLHRRHCGTYLAASWPTREIPLWPYSGFDGAPDCWVKRSPESMDTGYMDCWITGLLTACTACEREMWIELSIYRFLMPVIFALQKTLPYISRRMMTDPRNPPLALFWIQRCPPTRAPDLGLYTILPSPILYGVWHKREESVGGHILRNGPAIVLR